MTPLMSKSATGWNGFILKTFGSALLFLLFSQSQVAAFDLEGKVKLEGSIPEARWIEVQAEHRSSCGEKRLSPKLNVSPEGFVVNAVVKLEGPFVTAQVIPEGNWTLDQVGCEFKPHVLLLPQGARVSILNSDGFLHNVRAFDEKTEMLFNDAMPRKGQVLKKWLGQPGRYVLRCGIHPWMHALVIVTEHPYYALTDESGHFKIEGIPEGSYTLSVWHEELGEIKTRVDSKAGPLSLTYPAKLRSS